MKNELDKFLIGTLYQVNSKKGYISRKNIHGKSQTELLEYGYLIDDNEKKVPIINKVDTVIVRNKNLMIGQLSEVVTGIKFDELPIVRNSDLNNDWNAYTVGGIKGEYDTFIVIDNYRKVTVEALEEYFKNHANVEEYSRKLSEIKKSGLYYHKLSLQKEKELLKKSNERVRLLINK